jgi:hypothetical protein
MGLVWADFTQKLTFFVIEMWAESVNILTDSFNFWDWVVQHGGIVARGRPNHKTKGNLGTNRTRSP